MTSAWSLRLLRVGGALHVVVVTVGCQSPRAGEVSVTEAHSQLVRESPLGVPDTCVYVVDVAGGANVTFTTTPAYVAQLRSRVSEQAAMHGPGRYEGKGHGAIHGTSHSHGMRLWAMPVGVLNQVDVARGVRLEVIANDQGNVAPLRAQLREQAANLGARHCP